MRRFLAFLVAAAVGTAVVAVPVGAALCQDSSAPQKPVSCCAGQDDDCGMEDCDCEVTSAPEMPDDTAMLAASTKPFHVPAIDTHHGIEFSAINTPDSTVVNSAQSRAPPPPDRSGHQLRAPPISLA